MQLPLLTDSLVLIAGTDVSHVCTDLSQTFCVLITQKVALNDDDVTCLHYKHGDDSVLPPQRRPTYSQPSIMPRKQWVVVKTERMEDDDLIVVSGDEDEEDEDEREMELARERQRSDFNISNVRSLSAEPGGRLEADLDSQVRSTHCKDSVWDVSV